MLLWIQVALRKTSKININSGLIYNRESEKLQGDLNFKKLVTRWKPRRR